MGNSSFATAVLALATAAGVTACKVTESNPSETTTGGSDDCLVSDACCALAQQRGDANPREGAEDCSGEQVGGQGGQEWCDEAAELAKKALHAEQVEGECLLSLVPETVTRVPVVWVNSTNEGKVALFDSTTGEQILRSPTYGYFPNRTAVASDGSVWITNRDSYHYIHIGLDGKPLCASEYGAEQAYDDPARVGYTRAAAIDSSGYVWIGFHDSGEVIKVDPQETEGSVKLTDSFTGDTVEAPKCKELLRLEVGANPYGLAADGDGNLWTGALGNGPVAKIDARDGKVVGVYDLSDDPMIQEQGEDCVDLYGMAIDMDGNPWFANMSCRNVVKLDKSTGKVSGLYSHDDFSTPRALGIDREGHMWVADNGSSFVHELSQDGAWIKKVDVSCTGDTIPGTLGTGSDVDGNMWTVLQHEGLVRKYETSGKSVGCYPEEPISKLDSPYTYSDLTGSTNALVTSQLGRFRAVVSHDGAIQWALVSYKGTVPEGTSVCVRARAAQTKKELESASWTGALCEASKVGGWLVHGLMPDGKPLVEKSPYLELELQLGSSDPKVTPKVSGLSVAGLK